jgi:hypothetical protein
MYGIYLVSIDKEINPPQRRKGRREIFNECN